MPEWDKKEAKKFAIEMLEEEILYVKGRSREEAMKAYRRLLLDFDDEPIYYVRS